MQTEKYTEQDERDIEEKYQRLNKAKAWFDTKYIKDEEKLTLVQISYINRYSITIIGLWPLNALVRTQWDLIISSLAIIFLLPVLIGILSIYISIYWVVLLGVVPGIMWLLFSLKHGRRLAWNRNGWKSFEDFKKSERKWTLWAWITIAFYVLLAIVWQ